MDGERGFIILVYILLLAGLAILFVGGELLVRGAVGAARGLGISPLLIGITLVGFGTSTPELFASVKAALADSPGIAIGNVVGSNIANILLILGITALLAPIAILRDSFRRDGAVMLGATALVGAVLLRDHIGRWMGLFFIALLAAYLVHCYFSEKSGRIESQHAAEAAVIEPVRGPIWRPIVLAILGLAGVIFGARLLVEAAIELAVMSGVSETVIGVSIVAVGTSLPELAASVSAALRRHGDIAIGNILGSNIFNLLFILGATAIIRPLSVPAEILQLDYWVMAGASILLVLVAYTGWQIVRREAVLFLLLYAGYMTLLFWPPAQTLLGVQ